MKNFPVDFQFNSAASEKLIDQDIDNYEIMQKEKFTDVKFVISNKHMSNKAG